MSTQKKVLVTGASRGIGKAILKTFANEEHYLVGTATSAEGLKTIEEILTSSNSSGEGIVLTQNGRNSFNSKINKTQLKS